MKKRNISVFLIICCFFVIGTITAFAENDISVLVNDKELVFDVQPIIQEGRTLTPLRVVFEELEMNVTWNDETKTVTAQKEGIEIILPVYQKIAYKNNEEMVLDVPATIIDGRTLVPLRFVAESLGMIVEWDGTTRTVLISDIPENIEEVIEPEIIEEATSTVESTKMNIKGITMGMTETEITDVLGNPNRKDPSKYGFPWNIYNADYSSYMQIGIENGQVAAIYSNSDSWRMNGIGIGTTKELVEVKYGEPVASIEKDGTIYQLASSKGDKAVYLIDGNYVTFYYDLLDDYKVTAILLVNKSSEESFIGQYASADAQIADVHEAQMLDIINAIRYRMKLELFILDNTIANTARKHSTNMIKYKFYAHIDQNQKDPFDRMKDDKISFKNAAENILKGTATSYDAVQKFMNSKLHRENILGDYQYLGVGIDYDEKGSLYITQNFYTPGD